MSDYAVAGGSSTDAALLWVLTSRTETDTLLDISDRSGLPIRRCARLQRC
jgi:hypothetical protein